MQIVYIITFVVLVVLVVAILLSMVNKSQTKSHYEDLLDSDRPVSPPMPYHIDPNPQGIRTTTYPNGEARIHNPPLMPLKQADLEY